MERKLKLLREEVDEELRNELNYSVVAAAASIPRDRIYKTLRVPMVRSAKKRLSPLYAVKIAIVLQLDETEATEFLHRCGYAIEYDVFPEYPVYREAIALAHAGTEIGEVEALLEEVIDICEDDSMNVELADYVIPRLRSEHFSP